MSLKAGTRLGPYEVVAVIGAGGMAEVYRARDSRLGRDVAIKVLPEEGVDQPARLHRFETEARTLAALEHPHILAVHDFGVAEGHPYIVSELLEGQTLRERLRQGTSASGRRSSWSRRRRAGSRPPTRKASSTATSSPRTCSSRRRVGSRSSTSAWPGCVTRTSRAPWRRLCLRKRSPSLG